MSPPAAPAEAHAVLGHPRLHLRVTDSTNARASELAGRGAPHGTLVTASEQRAGRGRQGRTWSAPAGRALLCSLIVRRPPELLSLATGVAVAEMAAAPGGESPGGESPAPGHDVAIKWPNDVLLDGRKLAGILVEGRPQEDWAVVGIGVNVAVDLEDLPSELRPTAATLGLGAEAIEPTLVRLLHELGRWLAVPADEVLQAVRARDALRGQTVRWGGGQGRAIGIDERGRLQIQTVQGTMALDAGEVHLLGEPAPPP
jgi:BirA family biotin operon repressor/biotin-[acetyl-CoA-carboxylase] ligase